MDALLLTQAAPTGSPPPDPFIATMLAERDAFSTALASGAVIPHYQPILDLRSGIVVAVEALSRWRHPQRGLLGPAEFLPLVSAAGLSIELGGRTLSRAVRDLVRWPSNLWRDRPLPLHVNVLADELADPTYPQRVLRICSAVGFDPSRLVVEVSEQIASPGHARAALKALRSFGVRVALDDFGAGDSSLTALRELPLDILKIDRSFLASLGRDSRDDALMQGMMGVAHILGLEVIAVGVEDAAQRTLLLGADCRMGQGFLFSRAVSPELCLRYMMATPAPSTVAIPRRWRVT